MLRILFFMLILAGAGLGVGYPWAAATVSGYEIGTWRVFDRERGYATAEANIAPAEAPVSITVDIRTEGALARTQGGAILVVDVTGENGEPVLSAAMDFADAEGRAVNPQTGETVYSDIAGRLAIVDRNRYRFAFKPGDNSTQKLISANLTLNAGAFDLDPRAIPVGYILMAVGVIGFAASFFRKRHEGPDAPPPPRWGRGG